jgi:hypothetical protein
MSETNKTLQRWKCHHEYIEPVDGNDYGDWVSYDDAAKLLAENERLRAENERLDNEDTKTRHALGGWVFVPPDGGAEPTHERVAAVVAEVERLRETNERLREAAEDALWFIGTEYDRVGLHKAGKSWRSTKDGAAYKLRAALKEDGR